MTEQTGQVEVQIENGNVQASYAGVPARLKDRIAIVGFAEGHREEAPNNPEWEMWGLNRLHSVMDRRWDAWFELHPLDWYNDDNEHQEFLKGFEGPVYLRPQDIGHYEIPNEQSYPLKTVLDNFPPYFTNSVSYMWALAILMHPKMIGCWGVDMAQDQILQSEYSKQRPSLEFLMGVAAGRGIELMLPPGTDLLKASYLYGIDDDTPMRQKWVHRMKELGERKEKMKQEMSALEARQKQLFAGINQMDGAMQDVSYNLANFWPQVPLT